MGNSTQTSLPSDFTPIADPSGGLPSDFAPVADPQVKAEQGLQQEESQPYHGFLPGHLYDEAKRNVKDLASGTLQLGKDILGPDPWTGKKGTLTRDIGAPLAQELDKSSELWKQGRYTEAAGHYIASYIPFLGPWAASVGTQAGKGDIGGALVSATVPIAAGELAKVGTDYARNLGRGALRSAVGAGDVAAERASAEATEKATAATQQNQAATSAITEANKRSLAEARTTHEAEVADIDAENKAAKQSWSDSVNKIAADNQASIDAVKAGAKAEEAAKANAHTLAGGLPDLERVETAKARAAYPKIKGTVDSAIINKGLSTALDYLKGAGKAPSSLTRAIEDTSLEPAKSTGPAVMGKTLDLSDPQQLKTFEKMKEQGVFTPEEIKRMQGSSELKTFDDLHGMYSEMGRELYSSRDLPGDTVAALKAGRTFLRGQMENLAEPENKVDQFREAQKGWMKVENTFRNASPQGGSPIARALRYRDPVTGNLRPADVRAVLSGPRAYDVAQEHLGRYDAKGLQDTLKMMKEGIKAAKEAPKRPRVQAIPDQPTDTPYPSVAKTGITQPPETPQAQPFDLGKWRQEQIDKAAASWSRMQPYDFRAYRLPFTLAKQMLARMLADPEFRKRIATGNEGIAKVAGQEAGKLAVPQERLRALLQAAPVGVQQQQ